MCFLVASIPASLLSCMMIVLQAISAAESADTTSAAEAALDKVEAMLKPDQAPGSQNLKRLRDQLMLQLSRCVTLSNQGIHCIILCDVICG